MTLIYNNNNNNSKGRYGVQRHWFMLQVQSTTTMVALLLVILFCSSSVTVQVVDAAIPPQVVYPLPNITETLHPVESLSIMPLTSKKLKLIQYASILSGAEFIQGFNKSLGIGENCYWNKPNLDAEQPSDAYCTVEKDSYCFIYFKGSADPNSFSRAVFTDWIKQNINPRNIKVHKNNNASQAGCKVHKGFYLNYKGSGTGPMNQFVKQCMSNTNLVNGQKKQLVLSGHSQGAASAGVASVVYADYKPLVIGIASPAFLGQPSCRLLNKQHIWRIINTENTKSTSLQYDPVAFSDVIVKALIPDIFPGRRFHIGESLYLPPHNELELVPSPAIPQLLYISYKNPNPRGPINGIDVLPDDGSLVSAHRITSYKLKLQYIINNTPSNNYPFNVNGYVDTTQCHYNYECRAHTNRTLIEINNDTGGCIMKKCSSQRLQIGKVCNTHNDCSSRFCRLTFKKTGLFQRKRRFLKRCSVKRS